MCFSTRTSVSAGYAILPIASADARREVEILEPIAASEPRKPSNSGAINWREVGEVGGRVAMSKVSFTAASGMVTLHPHILRWGRVGGEDIYAIWKGSRGSSYRLQFPSEKLFLLKFSRVRAQLPVNHVTTMEVARVVRSLGFKTAFVR